jgi:hypothetical protein
VNRLIPQRLVMSQILQHQLTGESINMNVFNVLAYRANALLAICLISCAANAAGSYYTTSRVAITGPATLAAAPPATHEREHAAAAGGVRAR